MTKVMDKFMLVKSISNKTPWLVYANPLPVQIR